MKIGDKEVTLQRAVQTAAKSIGFKYGVDVDDLEQDIWVELLERGEDYANRGGIYTIAHSRAINATRKVNKETLADLSETVAEDDVHDTDLGPSITETTSAGITNPEYDVLFSDRLRAIQTYVEGLVAGAKAQHRDVLRAYYLHGQDYAQAAKALEMPIGTVKSRLARARDALGSGESALRAWREYAYPEARKPDLNGSEGHSVALVELLQG